jgi:hypothetical protein
MGGGEGEFEIGDGAGIRIGRRQLIGIFALDRNVAGPKDCRPAIALDRLRISLAGRLWHDCVLLFQILSRDLGTVPRATSWASFSRSCRRCSLPPVNWSKGVKKRNQ